MGNDSGSCFESLVKKQRNEGQAGTDLFYCTFEGISNETNKSIVGNDGDSLFTFDEVKISLLRTYLLLKSGESSEGILLCDYRDDYLRLHPKPRSGEEGRNRRFKGCAVLDAVLFPTTRLEHGVELFKPPVVTDFASKR